MSKTLESLLSLAARHIEEALAKQLAFAFTPQFVLWKLATRSDGLLIQLALDLNAEAANSQPIDIHAILKGDEGERARLRDGLMSQFEQAHAELVEKLTSLTPD